jgi:hypothetical protein
VLILDPFGLMICACTILFDEVVKLKKAKRFFSFYRISSKKNKHEIVIILPFQQRIANNDIEWITYICLRAVIVQCQAVWWMYCIAT